MTPSVAFYCGRVSLSFYFDPRRWHLLWYRDRGMTTWNAGPLEYLHDKAVADYDEPDNPKEE